MKICSVTLCSLLQSTPNLSLKPYYCTNYHIFWEVHQMSKGFKWDLNISLINKTGLHCFKVWLSVFSYWGDKTTLSCGLQYYCRNNWDINLKFWHVGVLLYGYGIIKLIHAYVVPFQSNLALHNKFNMWRGQGTSKYSMPGMDTH